MRDDGPDEIDADLRDDDQGDQGDQGELTFGCPACGRMIYEEAERCPACGHWITSAERPRNRRNLRGWPRVVMVVVVVVVIAAFVLSQI